MRSSALLVAQREAVRRHVAEQRIRRQGLSPEQVRVAMITAYQSWCLRAPWRFLPGIRSIAFRVFGRRFAARWVEAWTATDG